jgi:hypothetical protein
MSFDGEGRRTTVPISAGASRSVAFLGCSFTQGYGVEDDEHFASIFASLNPEVRVLNYGTGGHSTLQSLIRARQLVAAGAPPDVFVYGMINDHLHRNIVDAQWFKSFVMRDGFLVPPQASVADGKLIERAPHRISFWPGERHSAALTVLRTAFIDLTRRWDLEAARETTVAILKELQSVTSRAGSKFVIVELEDIDYHTNALMHKAGLEVMDCRFSEWKNPEYRLRGVGHPNDAAHRIWGRCISDGLNSRPF